MATAMGGIMRVERMKNRRSSLPRTRKRENAYAAITPSSTESAVEPNEMITELTKRGMKFDGPATTMLRARATLSQMLVGGGSAARYSGVCREMVVKRLQ